MGSSIDPDAHEIHEVAAGSYIHTNRRTEVGNAVGVAVGPVGAFGFSAWRRKGGGIVSDWVDGRIHVRALWRITRHTQSRGPFDVPPWGRPTEQCWVARWERASASSSGPPSCAWIAERMEIIEPTTSPHPAPSASLIVPCRLLSVKVRTGVRWDSSRGIQQHPSG